MMKTSSRSLLMLMGFLLMGFPVITSALYFPVDGDILNGTYTCNQGITGLHIHIDRWPDVARFEFFPHLTSSHGCSGEFHLKGSLSSQGLSFAAGNWIRNPCNYIAVGLSGHIFTD